jgi:GAF domain-containing protein
MRDGSAIGTISLRRTDVRPFTDRQIALLQTFADQAVIALENARLLHELQTKNADLTEALEQQTATSNILRVISSSPTDVQPVFDTIVRSAVQLCGARFGVMHRFDGEQLHVAACDVTPEVLEVLHRTYPMRPSRTQVSGRAILTRAVAEIPDVLEDPEYQHGMATAGAWRSLLGVPMLRADGSPIGTIVVQRSEAGSFAASHVEMLKTFADQAVIAVENMRLFKELEARNSELRVGARAADGDQRALEGDRPVDLRSPAGLRDASRQRAAAVRGGARRDLRFDWSAPSTRGDRHFSRDDGGRRTRIPSRGRRARLGEPLERRAVHIHDVLPIRSSPFGRGSAFPDPAGHSHAARGRAARGDPHGGTSPSFTDGQIALMETFADQAVIAIIRERRGLLKRAGKQDTAVAHRGPGEHQTADQ